MAVVVDDDVCWATTVPSGATDVAADVVVWPTTSPVLSSVVVVVATVVVVVPWSEAQAATEAAMAKSVAATEALVKLRMGQVLICCRGENAAEKSWTGPGKKTLPFAGVLHKMTVGRSCRTPLRQVYIAGELVLDDDDDMESPDMLSSWCIIEQAAMLAAKAMMTAIGRSLRMNRAPWEKVAGIAHLRRVRMGWPA